MKSEEAKTGGEMTVPGQTTGAEEAAEHTDVNLVVSDLTALPMEGRGPQAGTGADSEKKVKLFSCV